MAHCHFFRIILGAGLARYTLHMFESVSTGKQFAFRVRPANKRINIFDIFNRKPPALALALRLWTPSRLT